MHVDMRISDDARRLAHNIAQRLDKGLHAALAPLLAGIGRSRFDRIMIRDDTERVKRLIWFPVELEVLADITATVTAFKAADILACLVDPTTPVDPDLRMMIRRDQFFLHRSPTQKGLEEKLRNLILDPHKIVSIEGPLRLDLCSDEVIKTQVKNERLYWGLTPRRAQYRESAAMARRDEIFDDYANAETIIIGQRSRFHDDLLAGGGIYTGLPPKYALQQEADFATVYIRELNFDYRRVNESKWPQYIREWAEGYERVMAFNDRVIMYVREAGTKRDLLEKTGDPVRDLLFQEELAKLYEAIHPKYLTHTPTRDKVLEMMDMDLGAMDRRRKLIQQEQDRKLEPDKDDRDTIIYHFRADRT